MTSIYLWGIAAISAVGVAMVPIIEHYTPQTIEVSPGIVLKVSAADLHKFCEDAAKMTEHLGPVKPDSPCGALLSR